MGGLVRVVVVCASHFRVKPNFRCWMFGLVWLSCGFDNNILAGIFSYL